MRIIGRVGLGLIIVAAAAWSGWKLWSNSRIWVPANVPISLAMGSRTETGEFTINVSGSYEIAIEVERRPGTSLNELACSIGVGPAWPERTCPAPSSLRASWLLTSNEKLIANGSSDAERGGGTTVDSAIRSIGSFQGQSGQRYELTVDSIADASNLAVTNPHLKVSVGGTLYEFNLVLGRYLTLGSFGIAGLGGLLLLISLIANGKPGAHGEVVTS